MRCIGGKLRLVDLGEEDDALVGDTIPVSTGAGVVTLSDGTTAIVSIPAAGHGIDPKPYSIPLGITNTSTAGFKLVLGASVSAIAVGGFVGAKTSA